MAIFYLDVVDRQAGVYSVSKYYLRRLQWDLSCLTPLSMFTHFFQCLERGGGRSSASLQMTINGAQMMLSMPGKAGPSLALRAEGPSDGPSHPGEVDAQEHHEIHEIQQR